jgi:deazaflavin-dependent oxidoreductase (nitroreductase family)
VAGEFVTLFGPVARYRVPVPLTLPRGLARFNRAVTNPVQGVYAWALPPWAVICHRGRRSGRLYRTPVVARKRGSTFAVAVLYGQRSDWVRNLMAAGGGQVVRAGRTYELLAPRLVPASKASLPVALGRVAEQALVADLGGPAAGFGRGPVAG